MLFKSFIFVSDDRGKHCPKQKSCKYCDNCKRVENCGLCFGCSEMRRFGGSDLCENRKCLNINLKVISFKPT